MSATAFTINKFVFGFFATLLLFLQFTRNGLGAYFSMYVSKDWFCSGYLLYGALIYLFLVYALMLLSRKQYVTGFLQLISLAILVGVMLYPFNSIDHVALLPFLAALQPIILFSDHHSNEWEDVHGASRMLWGIVHLTCASLVIFFLMAFPVIEKILIYLTVALLFSALQAKLSCRTA